MLSRARQYRKEGLKHQNKKNYQEAILAYRQARGEANASVDLIVKTNNHLVYALQAEVSINIAECLIEQAMDQYEKGTQKLRDILPVFAQAVEAFNEAEKALGEQKDSIQHAYQSDHESIKASNEELQDSLTKVKQLLANNKMVLYFNEAADIIREVDQKQEELVAKLDVQYPSQVERKANSELSEELKAKLQQAIKLLRSALESAESATDEASAKEIKNLMVNLYEQKGDIFTLLEGNEHFVEVKLSYLDFMLRQYGDAFHIALEAKKPQAETLPLYLSILNVLQDKIKILYALKADDDDVKIADKINQACVEMLKFAKKYATKNLEPREELEIQSYLFFAQQMLSLNYEIPALEKKGNLAQAAETRANRRKQHHNLAMAAASDYCEMVRGIEFEKDDPLYQDLLDMRYFYNLGMFYSALEGLAKHGTFSQQTISLIEFFKALLHAEDLDGKVFTVFDFSKENYSLRGVSTHAAFELYKNAIQLCPDDSLKKYQLEKLKILIEKNENHYALLAVENTNVPYHIDDLDQQIAFRSYMQMPNEGRRKVPVAQRPATVIFEKLKQSLSASAPVLNKSLSTIKMVELAKAYFEDIEDNFSKTQMINAVPRLLRECAEFLKTHRYSKEAFDPLLETAQALDKSNVGEVKLWREEQPVYKAGKRDNPFWNTDDVEYHAKKGRVVRSKPMAPSTPRPESEPEAGRKKVILDVPEDAPEMEKKTRGVKHLSRSPANYNGSTSQKTLMFSSGATRQNRTSAAANQVRTPMHAVASRGRTETTTTSTHQRTRSRSPTK